jgi:sugar lactone lactonase YvrE
MRATLKLALPVLPVLLATDAAAVCGDFTTPVAAGFDIAPYAEVSDPIFLSFDADGNLYTGRDASGSGGGAADAVKIHRIAPGGSPVTEYGEVPIPDPDTVLVDPTGAWAGVPGAVLVGSSVDSQGNIFAILPDETVITIFGPTRDFLNPNDMEFDREGRFLLSDFNLGFANTPPPLPQVLVSAAGELPAQIITHPTNPANLAFDTENNIYMSTEEGFIRVFDRDGNSITDDFAGNRGANTRLGFGPGGVWGENLIAIDISTRELLQIDATGSATVLGTDFSGVSDFAFGPDGGLYFSRFQEDCVWRVAPTGTPPPGATGQPIFGKKLLLKSQPGKDTRRGIMVLGKDAAISIGDGNGSDDDPVRTGATLRVASTAGDGFDTTYVLPREGWRYLKKEGANKGYKFTKGATFKSVLVKPGKIIKAVGKGALLEHTLGADPDPVDVVLRFGSQKHCMRFGGTPKFKADKKFLGKKAPAPVACPLP